MGLLSDRLEGARVQFFFFFSSLRQRGVNFNVKETTKYCFCKIEKHKRGNNEPRKKNKFKDRED